MHLTPTEWAIVEVLVRHPGRLITQRQLLQDVWGPQYEHETNYLRVHLAAIRKKLEPEAGRPRYFVTEPGIGYRFEPDDGLTRQRLDDGDLAGDAAGRRAVAVEPLVRRLGRRRGGERDGFVDRAGTLGEHAVRRAHEAGLDRPVHPCRAAAPRSRRRRAAPPAWRRCPSWFQVSISANSSTVPNPPGSTTNPSASSLSRALRSCMVGTTSSRVRSRWATSALTSCSVMTPMTSPPASSARVGGDAHQADAAAAVDQADAPVGATTCPADGRAAAKAGTLPVFEPQ